MKNNTLVLSVTLLLAAPLAAVAQNVKHLQPNEIPTNLPGATTIAAPPAGFDPISASDEDLAYHGFPPRPNQTTDATHYASWVRAMKASKTRIVPKLEQTSVFHGPAKQQNGKNTTPGAVSNGGTATSSNWSGYVDFSGAGSYGSASYYYIVADYIVPPARQAFGACTGSWDYSSSWVGIDGWGSGDVLQAGTESDAYCSGGSTGTYYSPWYEWYPYGEVRIGGFPVAPGDEMFVEVWHTSSTQGYAYMVNENNDQVVEVGFTAPAGTYLVGNSAEWVVERPSVGGSLATLTNYIADVFWNSYAYTESYVLSTPSTSNAYAITMYSGSSPISYPILIGSEAFVAYDEGPAY
ncbi:MAG TPA: G1 family glutamic endopeptidase [Terracidiphilus sp.]